MAVTSGTQGVRAYTSLKLAASDYTDGIITLQKNDTSTVTVRKNMILDLAGYNVNGFVTVSGGTLYCFDSETDDYDNNYGKIINVTGNVAPVQSVEVWNGNPYMMVKENNGKGYSFHRFDLGVHTMTLRPEVNGVSEPGLYYKSYFYGDEKVRENVASFGVALSVSAMPDANNMETACKYSSYTNFQSGSSGNDGAGVLLKGILKGKNSERQNLYNATVPVYGSAYLQDLEGNFMFGVGVCRSLREQVELIDDQWDTMGEERNGAVALYKNFTAIIDTWEVPNIRDAYYNDDLALTADNQAYCPACKKDVKWTAITQATYGRSRLGALSGTGLHYYLAEDITYTGVDTFVEGPGSYGTLCIHLNGHDFTCTQSQFLFGFGSQSSVMGNGTVYNGKNSGLSGGIIWNTGYTGNVKIHLYGGVYTVTPENTRGSAISIQNNGGVVYIHEGAKVVGSATAPAIYVGTSNLRTSELYMTGVTVEGRIQIKDCAVAKGHSTTIEIDSCAVNAVELGKDVTCTLAGDTVIGKLTVTDGAKFTVGELGTSAMVIVAGDGVVSEANDNMADYLKCFSPFSGKLTIQNNALVAES